MQEYDEYRSMVSAHRCYLRSRGVAARLGLERYAPAFRDNDVDAEVLPRLTADDLISIGVISVGHRRKLIAAIARLGAELPTAAAAVSRHKPMPNAGS
jgi:hypothetical protein